MHPRYVQKGRIERLTSDKRQCQKDEHSITKQQAQCPMSCAAVSEYGMVGALNPCAYLVTRHAKKKPAFQPRKSSKHNTLQYIISYAAG
jgi:hypothetical protein